MDGRPHSGAIGLEFSPRRSAGGEVFIRVYLLLLTNEKIVKFCTVRSLFNPSAMQDMKKKQFKT